jgi:uncharacterized protein (DUF3084 family)
VTKGDTKLRHLEDEIRLKDDKIAKLGQQVEELRSKTRKISGQLNRTEISSNDLKHQKTSISQELNTKIKTFDDVRGQLEQRIQDLEFQKSDLKLEMTALNEDLRRTKLEVQRQKESSATELARLESTSKAQVDHFERRRSQLESANITLLADLETRKTKEATLEKDKKRIGREVSELEKENKRLLARITSLEEVRKQRSRARHSAIAGIVFCVDLSGSLSGGPDIQAKDVFRTIVRALMTKNPNAYVGIVTHTTTVSVVRSICAPDHHTESLLDSISCNGSENYSVALSSVWSLLKDFGSSYPSAARWVILISDGQDC